MANKNPTPSQVLAALRDGGVDIKTYRGWDTRGRQWKGPDGSPGLIGAVVHHTATASATGSSGCPTLEWCAAPYGWDDYPACNVVVGRGPGDTYLLSAGSAYHCGDGGPVLPLDIASGYHGQYRLWGIEIDDAGVRAGTLTDYQIENTAKMLAALANLCGWDVDKAVGTHKCYTDGCHGWNDEPSRTLGRKNDTLDGDWGAWPGSDKPKEYNAPFWRQKVKESSVRGTTWDGTIPSREKVVEADKNDLCVKSTWRVACRLYDLGFREDPPKPVGEQPYPQGAVKNFQASLGWEEPHGNFSEKTQLHLFGANVP
jgi:hypothetical protein